MVKLIGIGKWKFEKKLIEFTKTTIALTIKPNTLKLKKIKLWVIMKKLAMNIGARRLESIMKMKYHFGHHAIHTITNAMADVVRNELGICLTIGNPPMIVRGANYHG